MVLGQLSFPHGSDGKESICSVGYLGSIPGSGRSAGGGHGNPLQCCCLENPMNRGAWQATVHAVAKSPTRLSNTHTHTHTHTHTGSILTGLWEDPLEKGMATHSNILA